MDPKKETFKSQVIWYKRDYGYGFIRHPNQDQVFFHHSVVEHHEHESKIKIPPGGEVEYQIEETNLGLRATCVRRT